MDQDTKDLIKETGFCEECLGCAFTADGSSCKDCGEVTQSGAIELCPGCAVKNNVCAFSDCDNSLNL